jgi:hypothetical protein
MAEPTASLHGIAADGERVQEELRVAHAEASPTGQDRHATTHALRPKSLGVWGEAVALVDGHTSPRTGDRAAHH